MTSVLSVAQLCGKHRASWHVNHHGHFPGSPHITRRVYAARMTFVLSVAQSCASSVCELAYANRHGHFQVCRLNLAGSFALYGLCTVGLKKYVKLPCYRKCHGEILPQIIGTLVPSVWRGLVLLARKAVHAEKHVNVN